jgi:hypothetical protein
MAAVCSLHGNSKAEGSDSYQLSAISYQQSAFSHEQSGVCDELTADG